MTLRLPMKPFAKAAVAAFASLTLALPFAGVMAQQNPAPRDFSVSKDGWVREGVTQDFDLIPGKIPPITFDPAHPFVGNGGGRRTTYRIPDASNPNLKPWVKERMQKDNAEVLAGKIPFTPRQSCLPAGVPGFMAYGGVAPIYFIQTPKEVWLIYTADSQVRRIYLNVPHSKNPKRTWYGESVGYYEGDTLVIDTIAQNDKTTLDAYRTPHSDKLHVTERWRMVDGGKILESTFTVEDPDAFFQPWSGMKRYHRSDEPISERVCAENNTFFDFHIPSADKPDF